MEGQTTASIYNTARKGKIDISKIFGTGKIFLLSKIHQYNSDIVASRISRYSNTQNKINDADFCTK